MVRTLTLSEEQFQFISKLAIDMKTQDNKGTSFPVYCIYDRRDGEIRFIEMFLSEKSMNEHLEKNSEAFTDPFVHIRSAAYNEEIKELMKIIVSLDELVLDTHNNHAYGI